MPDGRPLNVEVLDLHDRSRLSEMYLDRTSVIQVTRGQIGDDALLQVEIHIDTYYPQQSHVTIRVMDDKRKCWQEPALVHQFGDVPRSLSDAQDEFLGRALVILSTLI